MKLGLITYRGHIMHFHIVPCSALGRTAPSTMLLWGAAFSHAHVCATTFLYPFGAPHGSEPVFHGGNPTGSTGWYWLVVLLLTVAGIDLFGPIDPIASSPIIQWARNPPFPRPFRVTCSDRSPRWVSRSKASLSLPLHRRMRGTKSTLWLVNSSPWKIAYL